MINTLMIGKVFVDTSAFVALWNDNNKNRINAIKLQIKLEEGNSQIYTSSDVIGETVTVIKNRFGQKNAKIFLDKISESQINIVYIDEYLHKETRDFFKRVKSKNISFVDCSSVIAMKRAKIKVIFSFDEDFKKMGVKLLGDVV